MNTLLRTRYGAVFLFAALTVLVSLLLRTALLLKTGSAADLAPLSLLQVYGVGLLYDLVTASYLSLPLVVYLTLLPERIYRSRWHRPLMILFLLGGIYLLLFDAVAEWLFWDEFETRFNFIAVDYLVYTHEVLGNIRESYPLPALLGGIGAASLLLLAALRRPLALGLQAESRLRQRLPLAAGLLAVPLAAMLLLDESLSRISDNRYDNQLAANGIYSFFAAFRNNELDYASFYPTEPESQVLADLRRLLAEPDARFLPPEDDILHRVEHPGPEKRLNVVLITVESLSAEYLGLFGNPDDPQPYSTPYLDALAEESLLFTRTFATGTRTVRGLEALTLSLPPTPGRSIVKRPHNENLFSLGQLFRERGYVTEFLYGGHGYFDNMNYFFSHNGFDVVDRTDLDEDKIHFANIWGVADEDLYTRTLEEIDRAHAAGRPFFGLVMTTSNHRPYTYPEGRIDIPSHTGRRGAVKYTDYAIHDFLQRARQRPWFDDTLFVIVADHCGKSAGKTALAAHRYHIPLLFYSPKHIKPGRVDTLTSQIDVAPTLLGLLNFSYDSRFFGRDVLRLPAGQARAPLGNYQKLGLLEDGQLTVLSPRQPTRAYEVDAEGHVGREIPADSRHVRDTIAYYEGAGLLFHKGRLAWTGGATP
ncbi:LTA synthase family protein [Thiohalobacter sp. IOR34]|uniref:LTA synthase family protein n=1 Tax=Thiohalobacter sp. IOR34 TaxID=3057176 RepID=UPI0025AF96E4|nr:LTA synthase family protein [Thiohalobacter sp. IOR34]WJW75391.1 LTA synthase family protein [Thiohalobacter sp. IOR34]